MVNLVRFAKSAPCTKPALAFASLALMISFIFVTVITTAGKVTSSKDFYLVSFNYDLSNTTTTSSHAKRQVSESAVPIRTVTQSIATGTASPMAPTPTVVMPSSVAPTSMAPAPTQDSDMAGARNKFRDAVQTLINDDNVNTNVTFTEVRVLFSGICVQVTSNVGLGGSPWICGNLNSTKTLETTAGGDPFDLIGVALFFKDKIAFSLPWWLATVTLGIAMLCQMVSSIPLLPIPPIVQRVSAGMSILGSGSLLGGLVLAHVSSNTVSTLSTRLTMDTVNAHVGRTNQALGWAAFALSLLATICISIIVAAELALEKAERMADRTIDSTMQKGMDRLPFSKPETARSFSNSSAGSGLGRTMGPIKHNVGFEDLKQLSKARTRGEALTVLTGTFRNEKSAHDNMV